MSRIALAFLTRDKVELSSRTVKPLLGLSDVDLFWIDGSQTPEGRELPVRTSLEAGENHRIKLHMGVLGGPDAAVVYALTTMLKGGYEYVGLCESDVVLPDGWLGPTLALFERGQAEGLHVGAVSTRAYEDRILCQRDGYAVMLNLGWGQQLMTREAACLALTYGRTGFTTENRRVFCQLSGLDIGRWWAFRAMEHGLVADWHNDVVLASHGLASLALTPSPVEMIGQVPPLHEQGLTIATKPVELLRNDDAFARYAGNTACIRQGKWSLNPSLELQDQQGYTIFPHQVATFGGLYEGDWRLKFSQGFGPFVWKAGEVVEDDVLGSMFVTPAFTIPLSGPVDFLVSGGADGGQVELVDTYSGYTIRPTLPPEKVVSLPCPASVSYRQLRLTMLTPGCCFYGIRSREQQPRIPGVAFDWHTLPKV
jgi:hypothetical protein